MIKSCSAFLYGNNAIEKIGEFCSDLGLSGNAVLVCDTVTWKIAGERISKILKQYSFEKVETVTLERDVIRPRSWHYHAARLQVEQVREKIRSIGAIVVFGIGGGVNLDVAKASAYEEKIRCITVPTIFSTNAMTTPLAAIENKAVDTGPILGCVVDADVVKNAPWRFQAAGFGDLMSKAAVIKAWEYACLHGKEITKDPFNKFGIDLEKLTLQLLMENAEAIRRKEEVAFNMFLQILMLDSLPLQLKSPIPNSMDHVICTEIEDFVKVLHGEAVGISAIMIVALYGEDDWKTVKKALEDIGAPVTAKQLGIDNETVIRALTKASEIANQNQNYEGILREKPLDEESAKALAKYTGVIE